jgi:uncharacterized membrane protein
MSPVSPVLAVALNAVAAVAAIGVALCLRPWRGPGAAGPPWPWVAVWAAMPLLWGLDRYLAVPVLQPMSGAALLLLLAGWPLAVLAFVPVAVATALAAQLGWVEGLHRLVWLGLVPATLVLAIGAALRRWLPHHLFVYILGRAFFGTAVASMLAGAGALALHAAPAGVSAGDLLFALPLAAFGEAFLTGMLAAILVAFRPQWLATWSDALYLPPRGKRGH